jgi:hypothetical protein
VLVQASKQEGVFAFLAHEVIGLEDDAHLVLALYFPCMLTKHYHLFKALCLFHVGVLDVSYSVINRQLPNKQHPCHGGPWLLFSKDFRVFS